MEFNSGFKGLIKLLYNNLSFTWRISTFAEEWVRPHKGVSTELYR